MACLQWPGGGSQAMARSGDASELARWVCAGDVTWDEPEGACGGGCTSAMLRVIGAARGSDQQRVEPQVNRQPIMRRPGVIIQNDSLRDCERGNSARLADRSQRHVDEAGLWHINDGLCQFTLDLVGVAGAGVIPGRSRWRALLAAGISDIFRSRCSLRTAPAGRTAYDEGQKQRQKTRSHEVDRHSRRSFAQGFPMNHRICAISGWARCIHCSDPNHKIHRTDSGFCGRPKFHSKLFDTMKGGPESCAGQPDSNQPSNTLQPWHLKIHLS